MMLGDTWRWVVQCGCCRDPGDEDALTVVSSRVVVVITFLLESKLTIAGCSVENASSIVRAQENHDDCERGNTNRTVLGTE